MVAIKIDVKDMAGPAVNRVRAFLASDSARKLSGFEGQRTVREHLQGLDETRANKLGGRRTNYYGSARRATEYRLEGEDVIVSIAQVGMRLHYYGGTVEAGVNSSFITGQPTKYITIPATAEAYGHTASDFENLVLVWGKNRKPVALAVGVEAQNTRRGPTLTKSTHLVPGKIMYWLKESVTLPADPTVLPTEQVIGQNVVNRLSKAILRRFGEEVSYELDDEDFNDEGAGI